MIPYKLIFSILFFLVGVWNLYDCFFGEDNDWYPKQWRFISLFFGILMMVLAYFNYYKFF